MVGWLNTARHLHAKNNVMKFGTDYKIAAYVGPNSATIALKKKNGLLITTGDTALNGNSTAFSAYLGSRFCSVHFKKQGKRWQVTITSYHDAENKFMQFLTKTQSQYQRFVSTDYNGFKLKHQ